MTDIKQVKCGKCHVPITGPDGEPKSNTIYGCPKCGERDTYENIIEAVTGYIGDKAINSLSDGLEKSFRGSKNITFKKGHRPKKAHRFYIDIKL